MPGHLNKLGPYNAKRYMRYTGTRVDRVPVDVASL